MFVAQAFRKSDIQGSSPSPQLKKSSPREMDAFDGNSDVEESQATQMLLDLMPDSSSSVFPPARLQKIIQPLPPPPTTVSDSYTSSRHSTSLPTYHYHGLASTQTQTQSTTEGPQVEEGSQKENIQNAQVTSSSEAKAPLVPKAASNRASSSKPTPAKVANVGQSSHSLAHSKTKSPNPRPVAINALEPPRGRSVDVASKADKSTSKKPPSHPLPSRQTKRKPFSLPSRDSSQDSFARAASQDPEEQFIAVNKQFELPLSELGRVNLSVDEEGDALNVDRSMYAYSRPTRGGPIIASHQGNVLVEATPSNSSGSQSQPSQPLLQDTQIIERHYGNPPTASVHSDGYESNESFGRSLLAGGDTQPSPKQPVQIQEFQQTQPVDDIEMQDPIAAWTANTTRTTYATTGQTNPSVGTGGTTGDSNDPDNNPRSLVKLFQPFNHWRYTKYKAGQPQLPPVSDNSPVRVDQDTAPSGPSGWQETQPTTKEEYQPPRRNLLMPRLTRAANLPTPNAAKDRMEIVPDSEPQHSSPQRQHYEEEVGRPPRKTLRCDAVGEKGKTAISDGETEDDDDDQPLAKAPAPPVVREAEDDDDDEDDVPLAVKSKGLKGKGVARSNKPVKLAAKPADVVPLKSSDKKKPCRKTTAKAKVPAVAASKTRAGRSWETGFIPSSVPEQDLAPLMANGAKGTRKTSNPRPTRTSTAKVKNYQESSEEEEEPVDDLGDLSSLTGACDRTTEPGDNDNMEIDAPDPEPTSRKRKRLAPTQTVVKQEKKKGARQTSPPAKRLRSAVGSLRGGQQPTRVFALWKQDGHFYPGVVYSIQDGQRYFIKFDDDTDAPVTIDQMRLGKLRPGDDVLLADRPMSCKVVKADKIADKLVTVKVDGVNSEVALGQLRIAHRTITYAWADRMLTKEMVVPMLKPNPVRLSPSPSKMSMISLPPHKGNAKKRILARTGLVITLSVTNENWGKDRERVMNAVKSTGGTVVDDMTSLFRMEGKYEEGGARWILRKDDIKWVGKQIERLFLLADDTNQKPKFLMALALGIPCISTTWLQTCVEAGEEKDWTSFMLPQGFSETLGVRLSQQVDIDWGNSIHQLEHIMSNTVPNKLLSGATVLCIGPDMMPQPKGRRHPAYTEKSQEAINSLARIILCMGAEIVEAVLGPEQASAPFNDYTYIVTRNLEHEWAYLPQSKLVDWAWMKNCLLASRLVDMPHSDPDPRLENSQEA